MNMVSHQLSAGPRPHVRESDTLTDEGRGRKQQLLTELSDIRAMTLKPLVFGSTLLIREIRDRDYLRAVETEPAWSDAALQLRD